MAERVGFEPTVEFPLHTLSKRAPSTTRTSLRLDSTICERSGTGYRKTSLHAYPIRHFLLLQSFTDTAVTTRTRIVSDPLMSRDHLRGFSSRSASIKADSAAACCHRLGGARRPRERLAPRLEDATERAGIEMPRRAML